jgi:AraC family transcriptional regulator, exoenzyme S synthesis regulatory protein ExsA
VCSFFVADSINQFIIQYNQKQVMMAVINLPGDIFHDKNETGDDIIIHAYTAKMDSFKGKSILHKNAISLVVKGEKTMHFAEKTVYANDREIHFLSAGNCIASVDLSKQEEFKSILVFFDDKVLNDFYIKNDSMIRRLKTLHKITDEAYISFKKDDFIQNYISSLQFILKKDARISLQMKLLKFEELMLYLLENYPTVILSFRQSGLNEEAIKIRKVVESNVSNNLTVEELAFLCNLSLSTFKRRFAEIYKTSPNNWLLQQKMKRAANLLHHSKEKPGEVFYKLGYENHSSFTKSFKKIYGVTPKEFQNKILNV